MKKILMIFCLATFFLVGCSSTGEKVQKIEIFGINDFHGAIEPDSYPGILNVGSFLMDQKANKDFGSVLLASGDMFQGSAVSNHTKGGYMIDMMNIIGFDSMTIGNHEFDWGIENIGNFYDGDLKNFESNFPMLGANVFPKTSTNKADFLKPYTIVETKGVKVGIIGVIGDYLESSISASLINDYDFKDLNIQVKKYSKELRTTKDCDVVVVSMHDSSSNFVEGIARLEEDERVDAIFTGHTHREEDYHVQSDDGRIIPVLQGEDNGDYVSNVSIEYDLKEDKLVSVSGKNLAVDKNYKNINKDLKNYYDAIIDETFDVFKEVLTTANQNTYRDQVVTWVATKLKEFMNADIALMNSGGIRGQAFPINQGDLIDIKKVIEMIPFDNIIKTCKLTGEQIKTLNFLEFNAGYDVSRLEDDKLYYVATIDYVFDKKENCFLSGKDIINTNLLLRNVIIDELRKTKSTGWTV